MTSLDTAPSLLALPMEIHAAIFTNLCFPDLYIVRLINHYFYDMIPPPTHAELLTAETSDFARENNIFACVGCTRLCPEAVFSPKMVKRKKAAGGTEARNRFCIECGRRPLPGLHRYMLGARWEESGMLFVRCLRCTTITMGPEEQNVPLCLSCHTQDLERARAAKELERVRREAREQEERRQRRTERRREWIERGFALSDFSEYTSEEDSEADPWDWGQDDDMN
jgi:hypothetical protein